MSQEHGRRKEVQGVLGPPLHFENFSKKGCFRSLSGKKQISSLLAYP